MALFGKKAKGVCPVCGGEMDTGIFGSSQLVADGMICGKCEKMLRGKYDIKRYLERGLLTNELKEKTSDPLRGMTVAMIKQMIEAAKEKQAEAVSSFGGEHSAILTVEEVVVLSLKPLDVGIKRAKELKNKPAVRGLVQLGSFTKGDSVFIVSGDSKTPAKLLDVIPCNGVTDLVSELKANMHKKTADENINAWLLVDTENAVKYGDTIVKN